MRVSISQEFQSELGYPIMLCKRYSSLCYHSTVRLHPLNGTPSNSEQRSMNETRIFLSQILPIRHKKCQLVGTNHSSAFFRQIIQTVISRNESSIKSARCDKSICWHNWISPVFVFEAPQPRYNTELVHAGKTMYTVHSLKPLCRGTTPKAGPPFPNIFLMSPTSSSGHSYAAKCPPFLCSDSNTTCFPLSQLRIISHIHWVSMTLTYYRGMTMSSFGKKEYPVGILIAPGSQLFSLDFTVS